MSTEDDLIFLVKQRIGYTDFSETCENCSFSVYTVGRYCRRNPDITFEVNTDGTCQFWKAEAQNND